MVKAVQFNELGTADVLHVIDDYKLPPKQDGEVHAKPACTSVTVVWSCLSSVKDNTAVKDNT